MLCRALCWGTCDQVPPPISTLKGLSSHQTQDEVPTGTGPATDVWKVRVNHCPLKTDPSV